MRWLPIFLMAAALQAGCRGAAPTANPFGPTRVPAPGTGQAAGGNVAPYYPNNSAPAPGTVPPGGFSPTGNWQPMGAVESPNSPTGLAANSPAAGQLPNANLAVMPDAVNSAPGIRFPAEIANAATFRESAISVPADSEVLVPAREAATSNLATNSLAAAPSDPQAAAARQAFIQTLQPRAQPAAAAPPTTLYATPQPQLQPTSQAQPVQYQQPLFAHGQLQSYTQIASQPMPMRQCVPCTPRAVAARQAVIQCDPCNTAGTSRSFATFAPGRTPTLATAPKLASGPTLAPVEITELPPARSATTFTATSKNSSAPAASGGAVQATFVSEVEDDTAGEATAARQAANFGYHTQYRWISGRLEYSASTQQWKLRYIPIDGETDRYGGSVLIANPDAVGEFQPGDYVRLEGAIVSPADDGGPPSPAYQVKRALPVAD